MKTIFIRTLRTLIVIAILGCTISSTFAQASGENFSVTQLKSLDFIPWSKQAYKVEIAPFNSNDMDVTPRHYQDKLIIATNRFMKDKRLLAESSSWDSNNKLHLYTIGAEGLTRIDKRLRSKNGFEGTVAVYAKGAKIIYTEFLDDKKNSKRMRMMMSNFDGERWSKPTPSPFNSDRYSVGQPYISADNDIYFVSDKAGGYGGADLYKATDIQGRWTVAENLGSKINTSGDEVYPFLNEENILYFSSNGHQTMGGLDIFKVNLNNQNDHPHNMGKTLNSEFDDYGITLNESGMEGYITSHREGGYGGADVYEFKVMEHKVEISLVDKFTNDQLVGNIEVFEILGEDERLVASGTDISNISFKGLHGSEFRVISSAENYELANREIDLGRGPAGVETFNIASELEPTTIDPKKVPTPGDALSAVHIIVVENNGQTTQLLWNERNDYYNYEGSSDDLKLEMNDSKRLVLSETVLKSILHEYNKDMFQGESVARIDDIKNFLNLNPRIKIILSSHTDSRGKAYYNNKLSLQRAEAVKDYLVDGGVNYKRIHTEHFGESRPVIDCEQIESRCSDEQHQINRRTEILLVLPK